MKKTIILTWIFLFLLFISPLLCASPFKIGVLGSYYNITDSLYQELYGRGNFMFDGFVGLELLNCCEFRAEWIHFRDKGKMSLSEEEIIFTITSPIILGMRLKIIKRDVFSVYVGGGIDFFFYKEAVPPRFKIFSGNKTGFHFEGGSLIRVLNRLYFDLNIRYIKLDVEPLGELLKLGGFRTGIGLEYRF